MHSGQPPGAALPSALQRFEQRVAADVRALAEDLAVNAVEPGVLAGLSPDTWEPDIRAMQALLRQGELAHAYQVLGRLTRVARERLTALEHLHRLAGWRLARLAGVRQAQQPDSAPGQSFGPAPSEAARPPATRRPDHVFSANWGALEQAVVRYEAGDNAALGAARHLIEQFASGPAAAELEPWRARLRAAWQHRKESARHE